MCIRDSGKTVIQLGIRFTLLLVGYFWIGRTALCAAIPALSVISGLNRQQNERILPSQSRKANFLAWSDNLHQSAPIMKIDSHQHACGTINKARGSGKPAGPACKSIEDTQGGLTRLVRKDESGLFFAGCQIAAMALRMRRPARNGIMSYIGLSRKRYLRITQSSKHF